MQSIKFKPLENIYLLEELKYEVNKYFSGKRITSYGNTGMFIKMLFWIFMWAGSYSLIIFFRDYFILSVLAGLLHMFTHVMIAFNIAHDANHDAIFNSKRANKIVSNIIELIGVNRRLWIVSHNQEHHTFINIHEHDNNIEGYKLLRLTPRDKWLRHHTFQWLYAPLVYGLSTINYVTIREFKMMFKYARNKKLKVDILFILEFLCFKAFYYLYLFILPVLIFDVSFNIIITFFLVGHFIIGQILAIIFIIGHITEDTAYPEPENNVVKSCWASHVLLTTGDYATNSSVMQWLVGGINLHIAHHLFPKICHVHYKDISKIIKKVSERRGLVYREIPSFFNAVKSHFLLLKQLGKQ